MKKHTLYRRQAPARKPAAVRRVTDASASQGYETRRFVQPAAAKRLEIHGNKLESGFFQRRDRVLANAQKVIEITFAGFDAGDFTVVADAKFFQPERAKRHFALGKLLEPFGGDFGAVRDSRGET